MCRVEITGYGAGGEGVARLPDGKVAFVPGAARGDVLEVRLTKETPRSARAQIARILSPSPYRCEPGCPAYPLCGGCSFRHITYEEELRAKLMRVNDALRRIGGISACAGEILATGQTDGYRNKAVFHSDGKSRGFYARRSHDIVHIDRCPLLKEDINDALKKLPPGGEIALRSGRDGLGGALEEELDGLVFGLSGFFQVNVGAALLLYRKAREYAAMSAGETLVDLYCGVGALTLFVGRDAGRALGVEINPGAVEAARENAMRNGLSHIEFVAADVAGLDAAAAMARLDAAAAAELDATAAAELDATAAKARLDAADVAALDCAARHPDCVVVDPPRKGLSLGAVKKILELSPKRIVYVSCDPATLARDLQALHGYEVKEACAVDMFPRTANVECCCLLAMQGQTGRRLI